MRDDSAEILFQSSLGEATQQRVKETAKSFPVVFLWPTINSAEMATEARCQRKKRHPANSKDTALHSACRVFFADRRQQTSSNINGNYLLLTGPRQRRHTHT